MTLLALLFALLVERIATRLLRLREARWLQGYSHWSSGLERPGGGLVPGALCLARILLPVLPVAAVGWWLSREAPGIAWLPFASLVLVFSLGPRDLADEVDDYLERETRGDTEGAASVAREIIEHDAAQRRDFRAAAVEDAVFVQANNRIFGVVFWFVVLGPSGLGPAAAWLFRVTDLMRREAIREVCSDAAASGPSCPERMHFLLAWAPARLLALGYALAGSFEEARRSWRERYGALPGRLLERNDWLLVHVGRAALGGTAPAAADGTHRVRSALRLVRHALVFWLSVIALLSLAAWIA